MLTSINLPLDSLFTIVSSQLFIVVFTFLTADYSFGLLVLISSIQCTKQKIYEPQLLMKEAVG